MAGSFTNTLTKADDTAYSLQGSGTMADGATSWMPVATPTGLILTTNQGSLGASLVIPDLDSQGVIQGFTANFQMLLNGAADGTAFAFGPDISDSMSPFGETGPGMSQGGLAVSFDIYNNGAPDFIGISVMLNGVEYGLAPMTLSSADWQDVMIRLNRNGTLDLTYGGKTIYAGLFLPGYTDVYGQFGFGARTGGSSAIQGVRNLGITTTKKGSDVTASITKQPVSVTVDEPQAATFSVDFDGTPPFTFQWLRNGTAIPDATGNTFSLAATSAADNAASYKCTVANALGTVTSTAAILTVKSDTIAPTVVSAKGALDFTHVTLVFSEPVTAATAETVGNYKFDNGLTVSAAVLDTNVFKTVVLTTSAQKPALTYTITINGVKDQSYGANSVAADTKVTFVSESLKVVGVGAIQKEGNTTYDVGISFNLPYDHASAATLANYTLSGGAVSTIATLDNGYGVVLTVSGLTAGKDYTLAVANVKDKGGNVMAPVSNTFQVSKMKWGVVGGDRLNLGNNVVTVGDKGFDVYSDGATEWNNYDESTFVYEQITGDFDKKLRVEYQDSSSQWARAGLIVREVTNFGVTDAQQFGSQAEGNSGVAPFDGKACRYQKVHVNPVLTVMETAGNNSYEGNRRMEVGGPSSSAGGGGVPAYPNAWCRLQRVGDLFTIYSSDDGVKWTQLGTTTFPEPMPKTLFVGPDYSPENGNITDESLRGMWVAKFRDYGDTKAASARTYGVGLNFGATFITNSSLAATDVAGVPAVAQANWNNLVGASGTNSAVVADDNGVSGSTGVTVTWTSANLWSSTGSGEENNKFTGADMALMTGYLDTGNATTTDVTITGIPDKLTSAGYDVYVYAMGGVAAGRSGGYRILDANSKAVLKDWVIATSSSNAAAYAQVPLSTDPAKPGVGNYIVFSGINAANIIVEASTANGKGGSDTPRAAINAIQLIAPASSVPPPQLGLQKAATGFSITYQGTLLSAPAVTGPWTAVAGATSPYAVTASSGQLFFKAQK